MAGLELEEATMAQSGVRTVVMMETASEAEVATGVVAREAGVTVVEAPVAEVMVVVEKVMAGQVVC